MSFAPPFRQFQFGDLVFGSAEHATGLLNYFQVSAHTTDPLPTPTLARDLADFLAHAESVDPMSAAFHAAVRRHPKYHEVFDPTHPEEFRNRHHGKAALCWATLDGGPFAHYSLAGFDITEAMRAVTEKASEDDNPQGKFDPLTQAPLTRYTKSRSSVGAELRWLFRHRRVTSVQRQVQFWRPTSEGYEPCGPPWEWPDEVGKAWDLYHPTRTYTDADYPMTQ